MDASLSRSLSTGKSKTGRDGVSGYSIAGGLKTGGPTVPGDDVPQFTCRAVMAGLCVGVMLCFTNMYFGLQTGWARA